jgi:hypothetical protein
VWPKEPLFPNFAELCDKSLRSKLENVFRHVDHWDTNVVQGHVCCGETNLAIALTTRACIKRLKEWRANTPQGKIIISTVWVCEHRHRIRIYLQMDGHTPAMQSKSKNHSPFPNPGHPDLSTV